jgi:hypothetical protein
MADFSKVFGLIPTHLRNKLEKSYGEIKSNFSQGRWEPSELNGGKFCEIVLRILEWHTSPTHVFTPFGSKISDFGQATRRFEPMVAFPESVRFHIPKILNALYTIRNKRGVGHVGGDVDPNHMDATFIVAATNWVMAELVRLLHGVTTLEAQEIVEGLITKNLPAVWEIDGKRRILNPKMSFTDKTLLLLYHEHPKSLTEKQLVDWTEHSNTAVYRRDVLRRCHKLKTIEYDETKGIVFLSPTGLAYVEKTIPLEIV